MRIRFVTKAQLQVPQASKAEKHLMPDGPIPLFGSLPSAVSRQWGTVTNTDSPHDYTLPLSMSAALAAVANDVGGNCNSIGITPHASTVTIISRKTNDLSYAGTVLHYIVMGA